MRGVLDEVDEILSELPGGDGFSIIVIIPHGRISDGHPSPIPYFFSLKISMVDGIDYTIIIILELDPPILLQDLGFALLIIFICGNGLPISINLGTELPHKRRMYISRIIISMLPKVFLKISPIIYGLPLVTPFRNLGLTVDNCLFLHTFNFSTVPLVLTRRGEEEVR